MLQTTVLAPWKRRLSDPAYEIEGHVRPVSPGAHAFSGTPTMLPSHTEPTLPAADAGCGMQNLSQLGPSSLTSPAAPPTTVAAAATVLAPSSTVTTPPTTVPATPAVIPSVEEKEALSLLASDQTVKAISMESIHSLSGDEKEAGVYIVGPVMGECFQPLQPGGAGEDAEGADSKDDTPLSVSAVRELWQMRSSMCYCHSVAAL